MRRFVLLAATVAFLFGSLAPGLAAGMVVSPQTLPAVDADGRTLPLTIDQLDPDERARFAQLAPGSEDARRFLHTRAFLRYCREVIEGRLAPLNLPSLPIRDNYDRQFLSEDEATNILDVALGRKLTARMQGTVGAVPRPPVVVADPTDRLPDVDADRMILPLTVEQLDPDERASFARLSPESADTRRFLYTRGFLRYCRLVVDGQLAPLDLPRLPIRDNWDRQWLSEDEVTNVLEVALGMSLFAKMQPAT